MILGWSPQVFTLVSELAFANRQRRDDRGSATSGHNACVVILADKDKVEMEEEIRTKVPDTLGTRVVCRSGSPLDLDDLQIVSPDTARAIILVSPGGQYPDLPVAKTLMALAKDRDHRTHRYHIVTALHRPTNLQVTRMIGGDEAQVFLVDGLIFCAASSPKPAASRACPWCMASCSASRAPPFIFFTRRRAWREFPTVRRCFAFGMRH